jgi:sugar lactone lactonase YvrE
MRVTRVLAPVLLAAAMVAPPSSLAGTVPVRTIWAIAGTGAQCAAPPGCGDGAAATAAQLSFPQGVAVDSSGNVYIADWGDNEVRKLAPTGVITVVAGDGTACSTPPSCGDGGPATSAQLSFPETVAVDSAGNVYIADTGDNEIRKVSRSGTITRIAGSGGECGTAPACGDGGPGTQAQLSAPDGVAVDSAGNVYISDTGDNEIRKLSTGGTISSIAGDGTECVSPSSCGDGGRALSAQLNFPEGIAVDSSGRVYVADDGDNQIRTISHGRINLLAGNGTECASAPSCGDGGRATSAQLSLPEGVAVDRSGDVYVADWGDNEIRVVSKHGTIATLAGNGKACASALACGDGASAAAAQLDSPHGVAVDASGNVYVGDTDSHEVRLVPAARTNPARLQTLELLAFDARVARSSVTVRYVLTGTVSISLSVRTAGGRRLGVTHTVGQAGCNQLAWNRRLGRAPAPHGRYTLIVTATLHGATASSSITVKI